MMLVSSLYTYVGTSAWVGNTGTHSRSVRGPVRRLGCLVRELVRRDGSCVLKAVSVWWRMTWCTRNVMVNVFQSPHLVMEYVLTPHSCVVMNVYHWVTPASLPAKVTASLPASPVMVSVCQDWFSVVMSARLSTGCVVITVYLSPHLAMVPACQWLPAWCCLCDVWSTILLTVLPWLPARQEQHHTVSSHWLLHPCQLWWHSLLWGCWCVCVSVL